MCLLPTFVPKGYLRPFVFANFMAIFAMSWDIMSGYTGYVSFGHPFLIGIAGYTTAILSHQGGFQPEHLVLPLYVTMPLATIAAVGGGMLFFLPTMRVRGPYFSLVSLAFLMLIHRLVIAIAPQLTGADRGLTGLPPVVLGVIPNFYVSFLLVFVIGIGLWYTGKSQIGTVLKAIHMDEDAVASSGLNTFKFKLIAFLLSSFTAGIGGAFYTHYLRSISPRAVFEPTFLLNIIIAALIGGSGTIAGPIAGAYFITFLLEHLRPFLEGSWRYLSYSIIALLFVVFKTRGFHGIVLDAVKSYRENKAKKGEQYGQAS